MREYGKVSTSFWTRGSGKRLRGEAAAQLVALYLVSCRSARSSGVFYLPLPTLAHETGLPLEGASKALRRVIDSGFAQYDIASEMVWIPNHAEFEIGRELKPKDNRKSHLQDELEELGNHPFALAFWERYGTKYSLEKPKALASPFEGPWEPLRSQKQEQEQKQIQEIRIVTHPLDPETEHHHLSLTAPSAPVSKPKRKRDSVSPERQAKAKSIKELFCAEYAALYRKAPPWGAREWGQLYDLLGSWTPEDLLRLVPLFFVWRNDRVIRAGHQWGKTADCFVLKAGELDADVQAPERRRNAAVATDTQRIEDTQAQSDAQTQRVLKQLAEKRNGITSSGTSAGDKNLGRNTQPALVGLGAGDVVGTPAALALPRVAAVPQGRLSRAENTEPWGNRGDDPGSEEA